MVTFHSLTTQSKGRVAARTSKPAPLVMNSKRASGNRRSHQSPIVPVPGSPLFLISVYPSFLLHACKGSKSATRCASPPLPPSPVFGNLVLLRFQRVPRRPRGEHTLGVSDVNRRRETRARSGAGSQNYYTTCSSFGCLSRYERKCGYRIGRPFWGRPRTRVTTFHPLFHSWFMKLILVSRP